MAGLLASRRVRASSPPALLALTCALFCSFACSEDASDEGSTGAGSQAGTNNAGSGNGSGNGSGGQVPVVSDFPDAQVYVDAHNAVRAAVQKPAQYSGTWLPVPPVAWSDQVAATARAWADHLQQDMDCGLMHDSDSGYGENLAAGSNLGAERAVDMWASEVENYSYSPEYRFETNTGHYTQIVWRRTTHIGCASAQCDRSSVVVCRYDPPGNFIGQQPY